MQAKINWSNNLAMTASTSSNHKIKIDGSSEQGGENTGARPMELVLSGLGSCSAMDVLLVLKNSGETVESLAIELDAKRSAEIPAVFTDIHIDFIIKGAELSESIVKSAVRMSMTRLCSVSKMLAGGGVNITYAHKLN